MWKEAVVVYFKAPLSTAFSRYWVKSRKILWIASVLTKTWRRNPRIVYLGKVSRNRITYVFHNFTYSKAISRYKLALILPVFLKLHKNVKYRYLQMKEI
jgi:hypothetical protein